MKEGARGKEGKGMYEREDRKGKGWEKKEQKMGGVDITIYQGTVMGCQGRGKRKRNGKEWAGVRIGDSRDGKERAE